jgi:hypothetical protein
MNKQQQRVGNHHAQHRSGKQAQEAEEACEVLVVRHVADGINEYEQAHETDHHQHHRRERIEHPTKIHVGRANSNPGKVDDVWSARIKTEMKEQPSIAQYIPERDERKKK